MNLRGLIPFNQASCVYLNGGLRGFKNLYASYMEHPKSSSISVKSRAGKSVHSKHFGSSFMFFIDVQSGHFHVLDQCPQRPLYDSFHSFLPSCACVRESGALLKPDRQGKRNYSSTERREPTGPHSLTSSFDLLSCVLRPRRSSLNQRLW